MQRYAFDVDARTHAFKNRRDTRISDGLQVVLKGNVYSGCEDGVLQVRLVPASALTLFVVCTL
jgi:hypothetical protein